tara:strand:- start:1713 stop:3065 length:1353 start_codon:yes stop_codon:yes gene_type:complete
MGIPGLNGMPLFSKSIECELEVKPRRKKLRTGGLVACLSMLMNLYPNNLIYKIPIRHCENALINFFQKPSLNRFHEYFSNKLETRLVMAPSENREYPPKETSSSDDPSTQDSENKGAEKTIYLPELITFDDSDTLLEFLKKYIRQWETNGDILVEKANLAVSFNDDVDFLIDIRDYSEYADHIRDLDSILVEIGKKQGDGDKKDEEIIEELLGKDKSPYNKLKRKLDALAERSDRMLLGKEYDERLKKEYESLERFLTDNQDHLNNLSFEKQIGGVIKKTDSGYRFFVFEDSDDETIIEDVDKYIDGNRYLGPMMLLYLGNRLLLESTGKGEEEIKEIKTRFDEFTNLIRLGSSYKNRAKVGNYIKESLRSEFSYSSIPIEHLRDPDTICTFHTHVGEDHKSIGPSPQNKVTSFLYGIDIAISRVREAFLVVPYKGNSEPKRMIISRNNN